MHIHLIPFLFFYTLFYHYSHEFPACTFLHFKNTFKYNVGNYIHFTVYTVVTNIAVMVEAVVSDCGWIVSQHVACSRCVSCSVSVIPSMCSAGCSRETLRGRVAAEVWLGAAGHHETPELQPRGSFSPHFCPLLPEECWWSR